MEELDREKVMGEEDINKLSTLIGKEESNLQPVKPSEEDLKKLEDVLGLHKTNDVQPVKGDDNKKVLKYVKRGGNQTD